MQDMFYIWLSIAVIAVLIDVFSSNFFFVSFSIGSILAIISMFLNASDSIQIIIFIIGNLISIIILYPITQRVLKKSVKRTARMEEKYIGKELTAGEDIIDKATIKVSGIYWTVKNEGAEIKKGDKFIIQRIEGTILIINKKEGGLK